MSNLEILLPKDFVVKMTVNLLILDFDILENNLYINDFFLKLIDNYFLKFISKSFNN